MGYIGNMRTESQIKQALGKVENIAAFAKEHRIPARTLWRVRGGGQARRGTLALIDAALNKAKL